MFRNQKNKGNIIIQLQITLMIIMVVFSITYSDFSYQNKINKLNLTKYIYDKCSVEEKICLVNKFSEANTEKINEIMKNKCPLYITSNLYITYKYDCDYFIMNEEEGLVNKMKIKLLYKVVDDKLIFFAA